MSDGFDSPDGRTYSGPVTGATPGVPLDAALAGRHAIWNTDLSQVAAHPLGPWIIRFMHATQEHDAAVRKVGLHYQMEVDRLHDIYRAARDLAEAVAAQDARPAPEPVPALPATEGVYLYHWRFGRGEEFGLYWRKADADAMAARRAGDEGFAEVLGMAILGEHGEPQPAPELAAPGEVVHLSPRAATYVTPCCGQTPFDLKRSDRMTNDPSLVTCGGPGPTPELADSRPATMLQPVTFDDSTDEGELRQLAPAPDLAKLIRLVAGWERQAFNATDRSFAAGVRHAAETLRLLLDGDGPGADEREVKNT